MTIICFTFKIFTGMDYQISYTIPCGEFTLLAYSYEVASILRGMAYMAMNHKVRLSNVTITKI